MADYELKRFALPTGVELDVALGGDRSKPAIIFLHGFPESHRTWRNQLRDLGSDYFVVAPDQRGFAKSSKPEGVENYTPDKPVGDLFALADALGLETFTLVGHDWGGAIAWGAALARPDRIERLVIVNAPHPFIFQKTMIDDAGQRAASQYIRIFRDPAFTERLQSSGMEWFFDTTFKRFLEDGKVTPEERAAYLAEWNEPGAMLAMLNWYKGAQVIVPAIGEEIERPEFLDKPFPVLSVPTLVVWGMGDTALTPSQLEGLDELVSDLRVVRVEGAGHFVTWEKPEAVTSAIRDFLA